ncbi:hypothetical protein H4R99_003797 [Coemansia sp. RSA 1722]|nr:hypothetical protein H4R99_003797 [Coemansia sp. RSA 1722]
MNLSITPGRSFAGLGCLATGIFLLLSIATSFRINKDKYPWVIGDDRFRTEILWPAILLLATSAAVLAIGVQTVFGVCSSAGPSARPVHRPHSGSSCAVDNRPTAGAAAVLLCAQHTALVYFWSCYSDSNGAAYSHRIGFVSSLLLASAVTFAALSMDYVKYLCSNRLAYNGLFSWPATALLSMQIVLCLSETYYSFFTPQHMFEPVFGHGATARSKFLRSSKRRSLQDRQTRTLTLRSGASNDSCDYSAASRTPLAAARFVQQRDLAETPESAASWLGWLMFLWPSGIINIGTRRKIGYADLYKLDDSHSPEKSWAQLKARCKKGRSLLKATAFAFATEFALLLLLVATHVIMQLSGPFFLQRTLQAIEAWNSNSRGAENKSLRATYLEALGMLFFSLAKAISYSQMNWVGQKLHIKLCSAFTAELTSSSLQRRTKGASGTATSGVSGKRGSAAVADGKAMNILTADLARGTEAPYPVIFLVSSMTMMFFGLWYMYLLLGASTLAGIPVVLAYYLLSKTQVDQLKTAEVRQSALNDERITAVSEMFQGIRAVKLFGWESRFLKRIDGHRERQLASRWALVKIMAATNAMAMLAPNLVLAAIFYAYVFILGKRLTAEVAFTSISVFLTLRSSFENLPNYISDMVNVYVSLARIEAYLKQPRVQRLEERVARDVADGHCQDIGLANAYLVWGVGGSTDATRREEETSDGHTRLLAGKLQQRQQQASNSSSASSSDCGSSSFALRNITVRLPAGGLSLIAGPTGAGKSSLLAALVGEMSLASGRIQLPTTRSADRFSTVLDGSDDSSLKAAGIAYVAQEAWLRSATIRENILFGEPYNQARYEEALRVCALKPDLRILIAGDMTEIGERGVTLSGGQKQRVALARAVYSRHQTLLIDDCLSAVDTHTAKHILAECLSGKTSLMKSRTRVLVTHHVSLCLPYAQHAVFMRSGGVVLQGSPQTLRKSGALSVAIADLERDMPGSSADDSDDQQATVSSHAADCTEDMHNEERLRTISARNALDPNMDISALNGILVEDEEQGAGTSKFGTWKTYFLACGSRWFVGLLVLQIAIWQTSVVLRDNWVRLWVADIAADSDGNSGSSNAYWIGTYMSIGCFSTLWSAFKTMYAQNGALRASRNLHAQMVRTLVHATPRFFDSTPIGRIIGRFSGDMQTIETFCMERIVWNIGDIVVVLSIFAVIISMAPAFLIVAVALCGVFFAITYYYIGATCELKRLDANSMSPLLSLFSEVLIGASTIRAFNMGGCYVTESLHRTAQRCRSSYLIWSILTWMTIWLNIISAPVTFFCAVFALYNIDSLDAGMVGFVLSYSLTLPHYITWSIQNYAKTELNMNAVERVLQYAKVDQEAPLHSKPGHGPAASWPVSDKVDIENLVVEYTPGNPVLRGISLSTRSGEKIGVVGRTGAGKSTLSLAFLRFIEATSGRIILDGVDISKIGLEELRQNVTIIPQDPVLFNGSIRFNLDPFNEYPDDLVWDALTRVHLVEDRSSSSGSSNSQLEQMPGIFNSLDDEITENGQNLSLGQKQLVALARALARRSRLIIMDEATASVDFHTDSRIQKTIRGPEFANSTLFCIAHRLRTIIDYDRVLVLDKGKVVEFDTPGNLMLNHNGVFRSMCESSGEFEELLTQLA